MIYHYPFKLEYPVNEDEIWGAAEYLARENMARYYDGKARDHIESIRWRLVSFDDGYVETVTTQALTDDELDELWSFIEGQNSDGLGEGFEQNFSSTFFNEESEEEDSLMCRFQWNKYTVRDIKAA